MIALRPALLALLFSAALLPMSCLHAGEKEPAQAPPTAPEGDATVEALHDSIIQFHDAFPDELSSIRGADADRLAADTERTIVACEKYLVQSAGKPGEKVGTIEFVSARLLHSISERKREEWSRKKQAGEIPPEGPQTQQEFLTVFLKEVKTRALSAREKLPVEHRYSARLDRLLGDTCYYRGEHGEARKHYEQFLARYPDNKSADTMTLALAKTYLEMGDYDAGIALVEKALKTYYKARSYPYFHEVRWKLYHAKGDLDGMLRCVEAAETAFPLKLSNISLPRSERDFYELLLDFCGFRRGYTLFARGDFRGAREAFTNHVKSLDDKAAALAKDGGAKGLSPASSVYRSRSEANLQFLEHCAGLPAPADFELGASWATPKKVLLREARGKAVAIVFRAVGDVRAGPFIGQLAQFCHSRPDMEIVTIAYQKPDVSPDQQKDHFLEDLATYGYDGAAGFDPDVEGKSLFARFRVKVGSATLVVANQRGELVWFMEDPRAVDVHFAQVLLQRIATEK